MNSRTVEIVKELYMLARTGALDNLNCIADLDVSKNKDLKLVQDYLMQVGSTGWKHIYTACLAAFVNDTGTLDPLYYVFHMALPNADIETVGSDLWQIARYLKNMYCATLVEARQADCAEIAKDIDNKFEELSGWNFTNASSADKLLDKAIESVYSLATDKDEQINVFAKRIEWCWKTIENVKYSGHPEKPAPMTKSDDLIKVLEELRETTKKEFSEEATTDRVERTELFQ